jgi:hypothetical protein
VSSSDAGSRGCSASSGDAHLMTESAVMSASNARRLRWRIRPVCGVEDMIGGANENGSFEEMSCHGRASIDPNHPTWECERLHR